MEPLTADDPTHLGPFRLEARLGAGGMGQVYLGRTAENGFAAVKVIHPNLAADPHFRARFAREIDTARRVRTPWTAAVLAADPHAARPWLATEYIPGPSLDQVVGTAGPLPEDAVRFVASRLADALAVLHATGVVHRDLKPSNVLLAGDGPRLIDFGIARAIDSTSITHTGHTVGTPAYMSPEQALGEDAGTPSDVFSLAAVLTYAATATAPFGHTANAVAMLMRIADDEPDLSGVPEALRPVLTDCLAKDPAARPTADELVARLAPLAPEPAQAPQDTKVWPSPQLPTLAEPAEHVLTAHVPPYPPPPGPVPPPHGFVPYPPGPQPPPPPKGGWRPWMSVLNGGLAVVLLVAWLAQITAAPPVAETAGAPVPVRVEEPGSRIREVATMQLADLPEDVMVSPDGRIAYVTGSDGLTVIDPAARAATASLVLPGRAMDVAFSPDGSRAYVALLGGFVTVLDTRTNAALANIPVGQLPQAIAGSPDGRTVYCVNSMDSTVSVIDTGTNAVTATVPVTPNPGVAALTPDGRSLYVYGRDSTELSVVDTATSTVAATVAIPGQVGAIAFAPDSTRGYLLSSDRITVVDPARRAVAGEVHGVGSAVGDIAVTPDGRHLLVTRRPSGETDVMQVIDTATFFVVDEVPAEEYATGVTVTPDGTTAFVVASQPRTVVAVDVSAYRG